VQHHLFDGDVFFAVGGELGNHVGHAGVDLDRAFGDAGPHGRRHERLGGREDREARVFVGVTKHAAGDDLAVEAEGPLRSRQEAVVDLARHALFELREPFRNDHFVTS
jgi:hypothetical protein